MKKFASFIKKGSYIEKNKVRKPPYFFINVQKIVRVFEAFITITIAYWDNNFND
jgi:hypothetical protein